MPGKCISRTCMIVACFSCGSDYWLLISTMLWKKISGTWLSHSELRARRFICRNAQHGTEESKPRCSEHLLKVYCSWVTLEISKVKAAMSSYVISASHSFCGSLLITNLGRVRVLKMFLWEFCPLDSILLGQGSGELCQCLRLILAHWVGIWWSRPNL